MNSNESESPNAISQITPALTFWWACLEAHYSLANGGRSIPDDELILHYCANGTTSMVFAGDIRAAVAVLSDQDKTTRAATKLIAHLLQVHEQRSETDASALALQMLKAAIEVEPVERPAAIGGAYGTA